MQGQQQQSEQTLLRPINTEKATLASERHKQVTFQVLRSANKYQIRAAVEAVYGVQVTRVRTLVNPGKLKRRGSSVGKRPNWKKAVVTLAGDKTIDFFATE